MKKIITCMSILTLMLVMFGITSNVSASYEVADGKWLVNPYLLTDEDGNVIEIPMYIMNSIKTTFPDLFDYEAAKGTEYEDKNWGGTARQYAWNGVKVIIPQFDEKGATGRYYGIYPQGSERIGEIGFGSMIYTTSGTWDKGIFYQGGSYIRKTAHNPSLSFYLFNDQDTDFGMEGINKENNANPYIIFDGDGKAVAGLMYPNYQSNTVDVTLGLGQEFCWDENGVGVVANADASNCARVLVDSEEDDLDKPILDENGEPTGEYEKVKVPGEDPDYISYRFLWQYMEEKPTNLNNGYLNEGWRADNWDFYNEKTKIAVCLLSNYYTAGGAVSALELSKDETIEVGHIRAPFNEIVIPAGGLLYKLGYLERNSTLLPTYKEVQAQAYLYGRDDEYSQFVKCYNYFVRDIKQKEVEIDGLGYSLIEGTNTIEAVIGAQIDLDKLIDLEGISYCYTDENNPFSFVNSNMNKSEDEAFVNIKYKDFLEKALEEIKVSEDYKEYYNVYEEWLKEQLEIETNLKASVENAQTEFDNAHANLNYIVFNAEETIKNTTDETIKAEYQAKLTAITEAEKAIKNKKIEVEQKRVERDKNIKSIQTSLESIEASVKSHPEFLNYQFILSKLRKEFVDNMMEVKSYVAFKMGNSDLSLEDIAYTIRKTEYETYEIKFLNSEFDTSHYAIINAINSIYESDEQRLAQLKLVTDQFLIRFCVNDDEYSDAYKEKVENLINSLVELELVNKNMYEYMLAVEPKYQKYYEMLDEVENNYQTVLNELGTESPATGLYKNLELAIAEKEAYVNDLITNNKNYIDAVNLVKMKQNELLAAKEALGQPSTSYSEATGFYLEYENKNNEINNTLTNAAIPIAEKEFDKWVKEVYNKMHLEIAVIVNGEIILSKNEFNSKEEFLNVLFAEFYAWCVENGEIDTSVTLEQFMHKDAEAKDYNGAYTELSGSTTFKPFLEENADRWKAAIDFFAEIIKTARGTDLWSSPWGTYSVMFKNYCQGKTHASYGPIDQEQANSYPKSIDYTDFVLEIDNNVNEKKEVEVIIINPILGMSSTLNLSFVTIGSIYEYTPIIKVNNEALIVEDVKTYDIRSIANAYDRVYSEAVGLRGNDISEYMVIDAPELEEALKNNIAGEYPVELSVNNIAGNKKVVKTCIVKIESKIMMGDFTNDALVDTNDVIHLLMYTYFPEAYPANQSCDYDKNGTVDTNDVIYLLMHTYFPDAYPLQ